MARPNKIDQNGLSEVVLEMATTMTSRQISEKLKREYGVDISYVAVARYIKDVRQERAEQTKALVQEKIKATVPRDLDILDELIAQELGWFKAGEMEINDKLVVAKELRQTIDTKLKYSGAGVPENELTVKLYDFDDDAYPEG
ncbi:MAG: hypothetical protein HPY52_10710 [Firmicutes bacterium]|nr:hypothetical protein [Bacillota bacterium]